MNELLPIIRRKRRPLLPVESLHDLPTVTVPVVENIQQPTANVQIPTEEVMDDGKSVPDGPLSPVEIQSRLTSAATKEIKHDAKTSNTR